MDLLLDSAAALGERLAVWAWNTWIPQAAAMRAAKAIAFGLERAVLADQAAHRRVVAIRIAHDATRDHIAVWSP